MVSGPREGRSAGVEVVDRSIRWPLYLLSWSEPLVVLLFISGQPQMRVWGAAALLVVTLAHTVSCVALLRAGIGHYLGSPRPAAWLRGLTLALTAAGVAASVATFPGADGRQGEAFRFGLPAGATAVLFCGALTGAVAPLLPARRLLAFVAGPALVLGIVQLAANGPGSPVWGLNYLVCVGGAALSYRMSVWFLGVLWEMERAKGVQAQLAVAEERLRFARDLHDVLGRNLALIAINGELAVQLLRRGRDGADEHMRQVRQIAQDSMREMREVVGGYRASDLGAELAGARSVLASAGIRARVIGDGAALPVAVQTTFGWVVREATTNILRHSDATTVTIDLDVIHDADARRSAVLRVENDGGRRMGSDSRPRTGLRGLRERLAGVGGELTVETTPPGRFLVQARLPMGGYAPVHPEPPP